MTDDNFEKTLLWAEQITRERQNSVKNKEATLDNIKLVAYIIIALALIILLLYIIYKAYKIPEPPSILEEVKQIVNQSEAF